MKTILLLGGGNCQRSAARHASEQGARVVLADYTQNPPAAQYAAAHVSVSTFDIDGCIAAARQYHVDGVMTIGTDQPVYTAACVAEKLGLPCSVSVETALSVTNKMVMKRRMTACGIPTVPYIFIDAYSNAADFDALQAPYVIKPLDSQGQRGIFKLYTPQQVLSHLPQTLQFSQQKSALVESFYPSDEVTVSAWVTDGTAHLLTVTDRLLYPSEKHIGICIGHRFPSVHIDKAPEMHRICNALCTACGIESGALYVQFLIGADGIKVNELACRIGGAFEDFFIPYVTGFDILDAVIKTALGEAANTAALQTFDLYRCKKQVATQLLFCRSGTVGSITEETALCNLPFVLDAGFNYAAGDKIPAVENATARFGHAVLTGENEAEITQNIKHFYEILQVKDIEGNDLLTRLYPAH